MATKYIKGKLYKLKIADLQPDPQQARTFMDTVALNELAASIEKYGILVPAVLSYRVWTFTTV